MTAQEESTLKTLKKGFIGWGIGVGGAAIIGLTSFYYTTKAEVSNQREEIRELKAAVKESSPEEINRFKVEITEMRKEVSDLKVQVESSTRIMENFKQQQERQVEKMLDLLIEIKRTQ